MTKSKEARDKYFGYNYELTDRPDWGYEIHIAKTSCGWLPLFQSHDCFKSIAELKLLYETGLFTITDEYGDTYNWEEFDERVLKFNGGIKGVAPRERIEKDTTSRWYDPNLPEYRPISHFDYGDCMYASDYFTDPDGYEFDRREFS
jgi:hypothetical protein